MHLSGARGLLQAIGGSSSITGTFATLGAVTLPWPRALGG